MKNCYALIDETMINKNQYGRGFCNTKIVVAFRSLEERQTFLDSTCDLSAKKLTRTEAIKLAGTLFGFEADVIFRSRENSDLVIGVKYFFNLKKEF